MLPDAPLILYPMSTPYLIRPATEADALRLATLGMQVWLHTYAWNGISAPIARYVQNEFTPVRMAALVQDAQARVLVAERDENLLAYAVLRFDSGDSRPGTELATLYVQAHFLRCGIGRALLQAAHQCAQQVCGSDELWLMVNTHNERAIGFYQANGLVIDGETFFDLEGTLHKNWIMRGTTAPA